MQLEVLVKDAGSNKAGEAYISWKDFLACTMSRRFYMQVSRASLRRGCRRGCSVG